MPLPDKLVKRLSDIILSVIGMIILLPLIVYTGLRVWLSSHGPVFYTQERIGYLGKTFMIHKFRSMYVNAEAQGPALSSPNDKRVTPWGSVMRKWKLDELPQLWNVLIGEMSLVGPRPERPFFIEQVERLGHSFRPLLMLRPGVTSLGMIRVGYAENTDQIIERMKYDLHYIENWSLLLDIKILLETVKMIITTKKRQDDISLP